MIISLIQQLDLFFIENDKKYELFSSRHGNVLFTSGLDESANPFDFLSSSLFSFFFLCSHSFFFPFFLSPDDRLKFVVIVLFIRFDCVCVKMLSGNVCHHRTFLFSFCPIFSLQLKETIDENIRKPLTFF